MSTEQTAQEAAREYVEGQPGWTPAYQRVREVVAAVRAELAEAKAILDKLEHGQHWDIYDNKCLACARDARWPKKETT